MNVSRTRILTRGLTHCCPNCGAHSVFRQGTLFQMNERCSDCGFVFVADQNDGFSFRAISLNFGVTVLAVILPILALAWVGRLTAARAEVISVAGIVGLPFLLYRPTCSWSLMNYFLLFPGELPANRNSADQHKPGP
ncbi:hypothetical protein GALL_53940 [mine drainage metagenome]|uniref:DUF983 domain-containing protein n=1 Tax=mine drainage metagenome TaxID=410659 RepID=A0A1J5TBF7_9ZZZZ